MTDATPMHVTTRPLEYMERAGMFAMELGVRQKFKFKVFDGDRRRFGNRADGRADLKIVGKENQ